MNILDKIYQAVSNLGSKFQPIDATVLYIVLLASVAVIFAVCGLCFFGTNIFKLRRTCLKIYKFLSAADAVNTENEEVFIDTFFGKKSPRHLRESYLSFLDVRFGYPSEFINEEEVYEKEVRFSMYPVYIFGGAALALIMILGIMLSGAAELNALFVSMLIAAAEAVVLQIALIFIFRFLQKSSLAAFRNMQEEMDVKIQIQKLKEFVADTAELSQIADELEKMAARIEKISVPDNYEDIVDKIEKAKRLEEKRSAAVSETAENRQNENFEQESENLKIENEETEIRADEKLTEVTSEAETPTAPTENENAEAEVMKPTEQTAQDNAAVHSEAAPENIDTPATVVADIPAAVEAETVNTEVENKAGEQPAKSEITAVPNENTDGLPSELKTETVAETENTSAPAKAENEEKSAKKTKAVSKNKVAKNEKKQ